jgi:hypothetical protein
MTIYIYALVDPFTDKIRYIGKSIQPKQRLANHCNDSSVTYRTNWIQSVIKKGKRPKLKILEKLPDSANWQEKETEWIARGRKLGWPLTNCTSGGDGVNDLPKEIREKMRKVWLGRKHKPESLKKIGEASLGRTHTNDWKEYMSEIMKGREFTEEWRENISQSVRKLSDDDIEEIKILLQSGAMVKDLAKRYGVHRTTISKVKMGKYPK